MNHKLVAITGALMLSLGACTPAQTASYNLSNDSDNFRVMRRVVFVNGITDKYLLSIEGLCSITKDNVVEIYGIAHSQRDDADWNAVQLFAKMMLQIDRAMVGA